MSRSCACTSRMCSVPVSDRQRSRAMSRAAVFALLAMIGEAGAQPPLLPMSSKDQLSGDLRGLLLKNLPTPLYEASPNWGHQAESKRLLIRGRLREIQVD